MGNSNDGITVKEWKKDVNRWSKRSLWLSVGGTVFIEYLKPEKDVPRDNDTPSGPQSA